MCQNLTRDQAGCHEMNNKEEGSSDKAGFHKSSIVICRVTNAFSFKRRMTIRGGFYAFGDICRALFHRSAALSVFCWIAPPLRLQETRSAFHPHAQRNAL